MKLSRANATRPSPSIRAALTLWALVAVAALCLTPVASATQGDLYAAGTTYRAGTYPDHGAITWFGHMPDEWVVDINADAGDMGRAILAPDDGSVIVNSSGANGSAIVITWISADGSEKICVGHLQDIVKTGAVSSGNVIGHAGASGLSDPTAHHMHVVRQVNGAPAPLVLSGHTIVPAMSPWDYGSNGNPYTSAGPVVSPPPPPPAIPERIGILQNGTLSVKEGGLDAGWITEQGSVRSFQLEGDRIGVLLAGGALQVKDGGLGAGWVTETGAVDAFQLSGERIGILQNGTLSVKEGGLDAGWITEQGSVRSFQLEGDRIGVLLTNGVLQVKDGGLGAGWVTETGAVNAFQLSGTSHRPVNMPDTFGPTTYASATSGLKGHTISMRYKVTDDRSAQAKAIRVVVKNRRGVTVSKFLLGTCTTATWHSVKWTPKAKGTFHYYVYAKDLAGNAQRTRGSARVVVR